MKRYLTVLVLALALWMPALAQEIEEDDEEVETNAFGYPDKSLVKVINNERPREHAPINPKPECNDPKLISAAQKALRPFIHSDYQSIADRRKTLLTLKNVDNFMLLPTTQVTPNKHRRVAGRLLELKINNHVGNENIKVCQSDNPILSASLYLVMYDSGDDVTVEILNFGSKNIPSFVFNKD